MSLEIDRRIFLTLGLTLIVGCGAASNPVAPVQATPAPLASGNINLIFVVSDDLEYSGPGDVNADTANLTSQGLQRSLLMAPYLQQTVLGNQNVTGIYALEPMSHLQTANDYPDMAALETIEQFALLNQFAEPNGSDELSQTIANSYPLNASYPLAPIPSGVASPLLFCYACQGLDFKDSGDGNEAVAIGIAGAGLPGFYVFSAPWETISTLLDKVNGRQGYNLTLPATYRGPNYIYAISITPSGSASFATFNSNVTPSTTYPALPPPQLGGAPCTEQQPFRIATTGGIPPGMNTNETVYLIRHVEAHPTSSWEDGNYVAAGQWRALDLPIALKGKISPDLVYSIDPAQVAVSSHSYFSYVRAALTVEPYAIANGLPYNLVSNIEILAPNSPQLTSDFFFTGGQFSNRKVLVAWEHDHIPPIVNDLLSSYGLAKTAPAWPDDDYDSIWTVTLDSAGNLTVDNSLCEGIDSSKLPVTAPQF
jgi:hypothetical protein